MLKKNATIMFKVSSIFVFIGLFLYVTPLLAAEKDYVSELLKGINTSVSSWKDTVKTITVALAVLGVLIIAGISTFQFFANHKPPMQILQENLGKIISVAVVVTIALIAVTVLG